MYETRITPLTFYQIQDKNSFFKSKTTVLGSQCQVNLDKNTNIRGGIRDLTALKSVSVHDAEIFSLNISQRN